MPYKIDIFMHFFDLKLKICMQTIAAVLSRIKIYLNVHAAILNLFHRKMLAMFTYL